MENGTSTYKEKLESELQNLTKELEAIGIHDPENTQNWVATPEGVGTGEADPNVGADRAEEWTERRAVVADLEIRYNNIKRALKKIEDGTYGVCEISGEKIESDRLSANPAARTSKAHINEEANLPK